MKAKKLLKLLSELKAWGDKFHASFPSIYRNEIAKPDQTCLSWQAAANTLVDHYESVERLTAHLHDRAGLQFPPAASADDCQEVDPKEADADSVITFDGHSATLKDWCEEFDTPIELVRQRAAEGMCWELAITLPVDDVVVAPRTLDATSASS
jgi:hypothetical protein